MAQSSITENELTQMVNEINHARSEQHLSKLFTSDQANYLHEKYRTHLDPDAPGQPRGVSPGEAEEVNESVVRPDPMERNLQQRFGIKHEFNEEQAGFLRKVEDKYLKR